MKAASLGALSLCTALTWVSPSRARAVEAPRASLAGVPVAFVPALPPAEAGGTSPASIPAVPGAGAGAGATSSVATTTESSATPPVSGPDTTPQATSAIPVQPAPAAATGAVTAVDASTRYEPAPYLGWRRGERAPLYVNFMVSAGAFGEDRNNRLTTRESRTLEGVSGVIRVGAVLDRHRRLGARLTSFFRPTKKVLMDTPDPAASDKWGGVTFAFAGPEFIYTTDQGLYVGASVGIGAALSQRDLESKSDGDDNIVRKSAGVAGLVSLGYEWRFNKWFAANAEAYGGLYRGIGDNERSMNGSLVGVGMGVGF